MIEHLAAQLGIADVSCVKRYTERKPTAYEHAWEIRDAYEYHEYEDAEWSRRFRTFLHGRAWTHAEGPVALFNQAVGWLRRHRVLLPPRHSTATSMHSRARHARHGVGVTRMPSVPASPRRSRLPRRLRRPMMPYLRAMSCR
ncbi:DUF4158 domain-containing protein [Arthrobacter sp. SD76]|uniref:DUF4158 domain-containing protein n=1 Tax=Arthrobacter sp. SD76 TaxID=3415007 RepID=UPI003C76FBE2